MPGLQEKFTCFQEGTGSTVMEPESKLEIPVRVAQSDNGHVIGKQGRTAQAIRTLLGAAGMKLRKRFCPGDSRLEEGTNGNLE